MDTQEFAMQQDHVVTLNSLYRTFDAIAEGSAHGDSRLAHDAILVRLRENRALAEGGGWTACTLSRIGGGRLHLRGVAPQETSATEIPDLRRAATA
jgi:hypothetical protein